MKVKHYLTGPLQVNTYLAYDEATKKALSWTRADMRAALLTMRKKNI